MFIIFISIFFLVLLIFHWLISFYLIRFLGLSRLASRRTYLIFFLLLINFIVSNFVLAGWVNGFTKFYYTLSGLWLGFFTNLVISLVFSVLVFLAFKFFKKKISVLILRWLVFGAASALSLLGLWQAFSPTVVNYEVYIKDLPSSWDGKKVVHVTDLHLGPVYGHNYFKRVIGKINDLRPEAIFITGDLFDGREMDFSWVNKEFGSLGISQGVYYSLGNHDLYLGRSEDNWNKDGKVKLLDNQMAEVNGLQIIGIDYGQEMENGVLSGTGYDSNKPAVLLFHEPKGASFAQSSGIDLQLAGHTHNLIF